MKAIQINKDSSGYRATLEELNEDELPVNDVKVDVEFSTLNYKDALAITGKGPVVRSFPMIPGIDLSGTVRESKDPRFKAGDAVILNGWGVGEKFPGGYGEVASLKADWLIHRPSSLSAWTAMAIGTAGYTAMLCANALRDAGIAPGSGEIVVSGATGGVGSIAIKILSKRGYQVTAISGKDSAQEYLKSLGASEVIDRAEFEATSKPLLKERWIGAIDTCGGAILANLCASIKYGGVVTACGLAQSMDLPTTVAPFILRGVSLIGVDSVMCPVEKRKLAWDDLAKEVQESDLSEIVQTIGLEDVLSVAPGMIDGTTKGRYVVNVKQ
ncbi:oxidoreductase [Brucella tritici]|uniref:Oxidoreductase n=1 Tax=Brucella tritici TaxID=94626 RepID=A0A7V7VQN6_9HYPH|nr:MDR family oxidoreductase [Brucella tritici]KAB2655122.1 oxidoreductase [Brucella tritici]